MHRHLGRRCEGIIEFGNAGLPEVARVAPVPLPGPVVGRRCRRQPGAGSPLKVVSITAKSRAPMVRAGEVLAGITARLSLEQR